MIPVEPFIARFRGSLTRDEESRIRRDSWAHFFYSVIEIYERKAVLYLGGCRHGVERALEKEYPPNILDAAVTERTIQCAYSALLQQNGFSLFPSCLHLLKREEPEMLVSIGASSFCVQNEQVYRFKDLTINVFKNYMARERLFKELGAETLKGLLQNLKEEIGSDSSLFPPYLITAFSVQQSIGYLLAVALQGVKQGEEIQERGKAIAQLIQSNKENVRQSLCYILIYIGRILKQTHIESDWKKFFGHLGTPDKENAWVSLLSSVYILKSTQAAHTQIFKDHLTVLQSSMARSCLPTLRLIGIRLAVQVPDPRSIREELERAKRNLDEAIEEYKKRLREAAEQQIASAHAEVDRRLAAFEPKADWKFFIVFGYKF